MRDNLRLGKGGFFLEAARRDAVFDVRLGAEKRSKVTLQHIASTMGKMHPTIGGRGNRTNGANLVLLPLQADNAECRPHAGDFRDEKLGHGTEFDFLWRGFEDFARAATR